MDFIFLPQDYFENSNAAHTPRAGGMGEGGGGIAHCRQNEPKGGVVEREAREGEMITKSATCRTRAPPLALLAWTHPSFHTTTNIFLQLTD